MHQLTRWGECFHNPYLYKRIFIIYALYIYIKRNHDIHFKYLTLFIMLPVKLDTRSFSFFQEWVLTYKALSIRLAFENRDQSKFSSFSKFISLNFFVLESCLFSFHYQPAGSSRPWGFQSPARTRGAAPLWRKVTLPQTQSRSRRAASAPWWPLEVAASAHAGPLLPGGLGLGSLILQEGEGRSHPASPCPSVGSAPPGSHTPATSACSSQAARMFPPVASRTVHNHHLQPWSQGISLDFQVSLPYFSEYEARTVGAGSFAWFRMRT